jgi:GntP family gluconate:H+ symporter
VTTMAFVDWLQNDTLGLLLLAAASVALLLVLIIKVKLEPFIALLIVGILTALAGGVSVADLVGSATGASESILEKGYAGTLGHIAVIIGLGTVLGALLESSGAAEVLLARLTKVFGTRGTAVAIGICGFVLGIPVFFDIGIFVLAPLVYVAARRGGGSLVKYALPLLAGLSVTHAFLPPHPGPVTAAGLFGVDLGWMLLIGFAVGIPAFIVSGLLWGIWIGNRVHSFIPATSAKLQEEGEERTPPSMGVVALVIGLPLLLILGGTFGNILLPEGALRNFLTLVGTPAIALTLAVLLSMWLLGLRRGRSSSDITSIISKALNPVGMLLLVIGSGAFFGAVLSATGIGEAVAGSLSSLGWPIILSAFVISSGLRIAQGSATVAIVTTGGILQAAVESGGYSQVQLALLVAAVASGSVIASHVNDGGFWIIQRYFNMTVAQTLRTWTVLETVLALTGFAVAAGIWAVV